MTTQEKQYLEKQQELLQMFYKDFFSWSSESIGSWIGAGIFEFFHCIFMWIPYQEISKEFGVVFWMYFGLMGTMFYLIPYIRFQEERQRHNIYEKLKYLPVTLMGIRIFRLKKLTVFCAKMFVVFLAGQLFFSLVVFHEITWANIWYLIMCGFLIPYGMNAIVWWWSK